MADSESSPPKAEAEVTIGAAAVKTTEEEEKIEEVTVVEDVKLSSNEVEKEFEKVVVESDLPVSLKSSESAADSWINGSENPLPTSDGTVGESSEEVKESSSSEVEKVVEKLVSDSSASLKNLEAAAESWIKGSVDILTTSHRAVEESSDAVKLTDAESEKAASDETTRNIYIQPSAPVTEERRASWANCCGLLDLLAPNH